MAQIVCLANSYKKSERCIAGIDLETDKWIRPIGGGHEGAIGKERLVDGEEPALLDILEIELDGDADDKFCQPENVAFKSKPWRKIGRMTTKDIIKYTETTDCLLHNSNKKVKHTDFKGQIPRCNWKSLQLIEVSNAIFQKNPWDKIECDFKYSSNFYTLKATCPEAINSLNKRGNYLLTISLGGPYARNIGDEEYCYKMVAGIIENNT